VNGSPAFALAREDECHSLTLDGLSTFALCCFRRRGVPADACCACTHYL